MSLQRTGSPRFCTARRRSSVSSFGKGSLRSRIKGSLASSFLGSMSSRWSLNSKDGLADFILNDNGIRFDPLVRRNQDLKDRLEDIAHRSRSCSESRKGPRGNELMIETQQHLPLGWGRSASPGRFSQTSGLRSLSPWRGSPHSVRQRYPSGRCYQKRHRLSDGDVLKSVEAFQQHGIRKHRHSEGDVLLKCVTGLGKSSSPQIKSRKRSISEGEAKNLESSKDSPKSDQRTESKMSLLEDDENDYVDTIISSLRRNSVTEKYRQDILKRNGFYAELRNAAQVDHRSGNTGLNEHKYRNSYYGSFGSLDSIDSWSSCNSIENEDGVNEEAADAVNNGDFTKVKDLQVGKDSAVDLVLKDSPDTHLTQSRVKTEDNENEKGEILETSSWIDSSYWNVELLSTEVKLRKGSFNSGLSRRQRLKELRRRSCGDYDKQFEHEFYEKHLKNDKAKLCNKNDSLANLSEELDADVKENILKTPDGLGTNSDIPHIIQRSSQKYILEYLKREKSSGVPEGKGKEAEFLCLSKEQIAFCSGKHGNLQGGGDDVELVFDAINKEAKKLENSTKDLMVVFFVGKLNHY